MKTRTSRRTFLKQMALAIPAVGIAGCAATAQNKKSSSGKVMTVLGPIQPEQMGSTLPHEHVLVDFIGADQISRARYNAHDVRRVVTPYLIQARALGCKTLVECTPAFIGRDPELLQALSDAAAIHLLTNTGLYGAAKNKYLPAYAHTESADQLAARWIAEWENGIENSRVRPGFMKIGMDGGPPSPVHQKLVRAAARAHKRTGLTIASHTGDGAAALGQIEILRDEGVSPRAFIWVHAQNEKRREIHLQAARAGAWIEFDGLNEKNVAEYVSLVQEMEKHGFLNQLLISHDAGWYNVGQPQGGKFRPYDTLYTQLTPALEAAGFRKIEQLFSKNPQAAFTIGVRA